MFARLTLALEYTHREGITHRNISSAHVYDMRLGGHSSLTLRQAMEKRLKTKIYLEHYYLKDDKVEKYERNADIYALGVLFLEAATLDQKPKYEPEERQMGSPCNKIEQNRVKMGENYPAYLCKVVDALLDGADLTSVVVMMPVLNPKINELLRSPTFIKEFQHCLEKRMEIGRGTQAEKDQLYQRIQNGD